MVNGKKQHGNGNGNRLNSSANGRRARGITQSIGISHAAGNVRQVNNQIFRMQGSDFFTTVNVKASPASVAERILVDIPVSPTQITGTRLAQIAPTFERFFFTKFNVRYVPAVPTTLACQLCSYVDTDPKDSPALASSADQLVRQSVAHTGAQQWNFINPKVTPLPIRSDKMQYYTGFESGQNERLAFQGRVFVIQVTNPIDINGDPVTNNLQAGSIFIDWAVEFQTPQLAPEITRSQFQQNLTEVEIDLPTSASADDEVTISGFAPNSAVAIAIRLVLQNVNPGPLIISSTFPTFTPNNPLGETRQVGIGFSTVNDGTIEFPSPLSSPLSLATAQSDGSVTLKTMFSYDLSNVSGTIDTFKLYAIGNAPT